MSRRPGRLWSRLLTGDGLRRTRLHSCAGERIDLAGLRYLPHSVTSTLLLKAFGHRQRVPWLGYRAVVHLRKLILPDWSILEFGSGMSTLFLARRCRRLVSVESNAAWYGTMRAELTRLGVDYRLRSLGDYSTHDDLEDHSFDLVIVDGFRRDVSALTALAKVRWGGWVLLDNSDVPQPEFRAARETLLRAAGGEVRFFNDLYPFQVQVNESLLVRVARSP